MAYIHDVHAVALAVYQEARGEPFQCQVLVASVVRNRMEDKEKTGFGVITEHGQFTWNHRSKVTNWKSYARSVKVAEYVLNAKQVAPYRFFKVGKYSHGKGTVCGKQVFITKYPKK